MVKRLPVIDDLNLCHSQRDLEEEEHLLNEAEAHASVSIAQGRIARACIPEDDPGEKGSETPAAEHETQIARRDRDAHAVPTSWLFYAIRSKSG